MIKVNYNQETGKVISFGKDTKPYIEITEQERKQPLPDKYSYYAVVNGKFTIKRRTPTVEELHKDDIQAINREISELKKKLFDTEGLLTDEEYAEVKAQREEWRSAINKLEDRLQ